MTINRRNAIRQLALLSAGAALLPSCLGNHSKPDLVLRNFTVNGDRQQTLDTLTATLIPTTDTPGARETGASLFILKMLDDCSSKKEQDSFFKGMRQLDEVTRKAVGKTFLEASGPQRESVLTAIGDRKIPGDDLAFFYSTVRKLTILSYSSSAYFLTKVQVYELVPGRWHGCIPVKQTLGSAS
jgi:Gluconate 2-dehydrogenase subunit 3